MGTNEKQTQKTDLTTSVDLWKFFEERGGNLKESMFKVVTWIVGFGAVVLSFAVKEGFEEGLTSIAHPPLLMILGFVGLIVVVHAAFVIRDYGHHINRTFARADKARDGESIPKKIWDAGQMAKGMTLPPICWHLLIVVGLFAIGFALLILLGSCAMICGMCGKILTA